VPAPRVTDPARRHVLERPSLHPPDRDRMETQSSGPGPRLGRQIRGNNTGVRAEAVSGYLTGGKFAEIRR